MNSRHNTAYVLLVGSAVGWLLFAYFVLILPRQVAAWDAANVALPNILIQLINVGLLVQRMGLFVVLLLVGVTVTGVVMLRSKDESQD